MRDAPNIRIVTLGILCSMPLACMTKGTVNPPPGQQAQSAFANPFLCNAADPREVEPIQRLTKFEYQATLESLFSPAVLAAAGVGPKLETLPADIVDGKTRAAAITSDHVNAQFAIAYAVAQAVVRSASELSRLGGTCLLDASPTAACVSSFLNSFGRKAFRRPPTSAEITQFTALHAGAAGTSEDKADTLLAALLMAPSLLYRFENDGPLVSGQTDVIRLSPYALASKLSYVLWGAPPDDELLSKAADGSLADDDVFEAQVARLLSSSRGRDHLTRPFDEWLRVRTGEPFTYSDAFLGGIDTAGLSEVMVEELDDFIRYVVWDADGSFHDLLTSDVAFVTDGRLAEIYGVPLPSTANGRVEIPARQGVLTRAALLSKTGLDYHNPMKRGSFLRQKFLCDLISPPDMDKLPPGSLDEPDTAGTLQTTREILEARTSASQCIGCHGQFNALGFAFEGFDAIGRARTRETIFNELHQVVARLPVDTTVQVDVRLTEEPVEAEGSAGIADAILASSKGDACFVKSWMEFVARREMAGGDGCYLAEVYDRVIDVHGERQPLAEIFRATALSEQFRQRRIGN